MKNMKNENAVSPVIGVILMVVITVIIAAVLAVFAFGVAAPSDSPTASVKITSTDPANNIVTVQHFGGDTLRIQDIKLTVESLSADGVLLETAVLEVVSGTPGQFSAGDTLAIDTTTAALALDLNGAPVALDTPTGGVDLDAAGPPAVDSVRVTIIDKPSGSVLSKPQAKIS